MMVAIYQELYQSAWVTIPTQVQGEGKNHEIHD